MFQDVRFALRSFRRSPGFTVLAVMCLTLGIGATTAVFSWIEGILLRPFPLVKHQDRMVALTGTDRSGRTDVSWPDFQDLRRNCRLIEAFVAEHIGGTTLSIGDRAERATGSVVSANYFEALGVRPILGRTFTASEESGRNAHPVAVISYDAWKNRYGGDRNIIGRTQMLNAVKYTIIGVAPEGFAGTFVGYSFQFWVPASMEEAFEGGAYKLEDRGARWIEGFAVLRPGVTMDQAQQEISAMGARLAAAYPATNRARGFQLYPLWRTPFNQAGSLFPTLRISLVVACMVLFIACANVANLLLVRSVTRRRELTVRLSVGAARWRLLKLLLTEGLLLAAAGAAGGVLVAHWCRDLLRILFPPMPPGVIINMPAQIDWRVLAISGCVSVLATVLFGLIPALQIRSIDLASALKSEVSGVVGGYRRAWLRSSLVALQVSLSFVLLVGAGLLLKSTHAMEEADPGFSTRGVLLSAIDMVSAGYSPQRMRGFQDQLIDRLQGANGFESVAWIAVAPFSYRAYPSSPIAVDGFTAAPGEQPTVEYNRVGPGCLKALGVPLVSGREFTRGDDENAAPVAVVNEEMARRFWRGEDPVSKRLQVNGRWLRVVGVAKDANYSGLRETPKPFFYTALRQAPGGGQNLVIRTRLGPQALAPILRREVQEIDANLAPLEVLTTREQIDRMSWTQHAAVRLLAIFGGIALLLAAVGLYGVVAYAVSQSTRELGVRMALGAGASDLWRGVMSHGLGLTVLGMATGAALAIPLTRLLGDMLYKVSPRDPGSFLWALLAMMMVAAAACSVPAWRATRTDPVDALRDS